MPSERAGSALPAEENDHEATDEIVCPYCGHEYTESYEYEKDSGELDCDECGVSFEYERRIDVAYWTSKIKLGRSR